jgi:hypothetical protein
MRLRTATATVFATAILLGGAASTASAAEHDLTFGAGVACDFPLALDGGALPPERKTFTDPNGNPIVVLFAGKSGAVTYTNLDTDEALTFPSRGTALRVTTQSDGIFLLEFSGNVGLLLFPGDDPEGPSTTQINGRLVLKQEGTVTTVLKQEGNQIDVCAALS